MKTTYSEVKVEGVEPTISGILPAGALPILTPLMISAVNAESGAKTFAAATGRIDGFMLKPSKVGAGSSADYLLFGMAESGGESATPYEAGKPGSIKMHPELEFEGADYLNVGDGSGTTIHAGIAAHTELAVSGGKFQKAASSDYVQFKVRAVMNPKDTDGVRILIYAVNGYTKA